MRYLIFLLGLTAWAQPAFPPSSGGRATSLMGKPICASVLTATDGQILTWSTASNCFTVSSAGSGAGDVLGAAAVQSGRVPYGSGTPGTLTGSSKFAYNDTTGLGLIPPASLGQNGTAAGRINFLGSTSGSLPMEVDATAALLTVTGNFKVTGALSVGDGTVAGSSSMAELTANGSNFRKWLVPDLLTADLTMLFPNSVPTAGQVMTFSAPVDNVSTIGWGDLMTANQKIGAIGLTIDGGGSAITTGNKGCAPVEFGGLITQATLIADQAGSIVVDVWKDTYANYPPTDTDSITASAPPTLSSAAKSQDATLTGWNTGKTVTAGDIVCFNVDSAATVTRATLSLKVVKN